MRMHNHSCRAFQNAPCGSERVPDCPFPAAGPLVVWDPFRRSPFCCWSGVRPLCPCCHLSCDDLWPLCHDVVHCRRHVGTCGCHYCGSPGRPTAVHAHVDCHVCGCRACAADLFRAYHGASDYACSGKVLRMRSAAQSGPLPG